LIFYNIIHFIGIGGIGVSGLAEYFLKNGCVVSGSDMAESQITKRLQSLGAVIHIGHSADNIKENTEAVIYSSAISKTNPEMARAEELGIKTIRRAEMLGEIVNDKFLIAVAGTHGKTTTTAMIGKLLVDAGLDPLIFVGGNVDLFDGGASRFGSGNYAVVEADEYDRSFLALTPDTAVITNVDEDHLDIYENLDDIKNTFKKFCENTKDGAKIVFCGDDVNILYFIGDIKKEEISYGFHFNNTLKITGYEVKSGHMKFSIEEKENIYKNIELPLAGRHNVLNAAACFGISKILNVDFEIYKKSIAEFHTVARRLQLKYDEHGIKVYDDYAHHPKEIESSLTGLKEISENSRIIAVFQPHLFSRTKDFYKEFAKKLAIADKIILMDIYPAREKPIEGVTSKLIYDELEKINSSSIYVSSREEIKNNLLKDLKAEDIIVFQGAGDITGLCDEFIKELKVKIN
jgi:UDP-N-acetylmuramate--alanine ligase